MGDISPVELSKSNTSVGKSFRNQSAQQSIWGRTKGLLLCSSCRTPDGSEANEDSDVASGDDPICGGDKQSGIEAKSPGMVAVQMGLIREEDIFGDLVTEDDFEDVLLDRMDFQQEDLIQEASALMLERHRQRVASELAVSKAQRLLDGVEEEETERGWFPVKKLRKVPSEGSVDDETDDDAVSERIARIKREREEKRAATRAEIAIIDEWTRELEARQEENTRREAEIDDFIARGMVEGDERSLDIEVEGLAIGGFLPQEMGDAFEFAEVLARGNNTREEGKVETEDTSSEDREATAEEPILTLSPQESVNTHEKAKIETEDISSEDRDATAEEPTNALSAQESVNTHEKAKVETENNSSEDRDAIAEEPILALSPQESVNTHEKAKIETEDISSEDRDATAEEPTTALSVQELPAASDNVASEVDHAMPGDVMDDFLPVEAKTRMWAEIRALRAPFLQTLGGQNNETSQDGTDGGWDAVEGTTRELETNSNSCDEVENVVQETENIVLESENVVQEPENVVHELENVVHESENVVHESENVIHELVNVVLESENVIVQESENIVQESENVVHESENVVLESESVVQESENVVDESEYIVQESENVVHELVNVVLESENVIHESENIVQEPETVVQEPETVIQEPENVAYESENADDAETLPAGPGCNLEVVGVGVGRLRPSQEFVQEVAEEVIDPLLNAVVRRLEHDLPASLATTPSLMGLATTPSDAHNVLPNASATPNVTTTPFRLESPASDVDLRTRAPTPSLMRLTTSPSNSDDVLPNASASSGLLRLAPTFSCMGLALSALDSNELLVNGSETSGLLDLATTPSLVGLQTSDSVDVGTTPSLARLTTSPSDSDDVLSNVSATPSVTNLTTFRVATPIGSDVDLQMLALTPSLMDLTTSLLDSDDVVPNDSELQDLGTTPSSLGRLDELRSDADLRTLVATPSLVGVSDSALLNATPDGAASTSGVAAVGSQTGVEASKSAEWPDQGKEQHRAARRNKERNKKRNKRNRK